MNGSFSIPPLVNGSLIAVLALAVLIFFVFAMVLYLRRCISTVSQQYQDAADLSSAVTMLKSDKEKLEQYISGQEDELRKIRGEREEQEELRQAILVQQDKLKGLRDAVEALTVMQVERRELEAKMAERRSDLEKLEEQYQNALSMKNSLPEVRREYEALQKELIKKAEIDTAITTGEARLKKLEELIPDREQHLNELRKEIDQQEEAQSELSQLKDDIASLFRQKAEADAQFAALNTQIPALKKQSIDAENECNSVSLKLQELKVRQQEEEEKKNEFEKKTAEAEQQLTSIRKQVAEANTEFTALNAQLPELRKQVHEMGRQALGLEPEKDEALGDLLRAPESLRSMPLVDEASEQDMLQDFTRALREARLQFPQRTINALHTSLKCQDINPLTVLAGVSGTGKTLLPVKYAEFMGINQIILSVQPRWDSSQDLFGFYNYLERRYKATELARCLLRMDPYIGLFNTPDEKTMTIATDLGVLTPAVHEALSGCDLVALESNYDLHMLRSGPYPYYLRARIESVRGHLSNDECAAKLLELIQEGCKKFALCHLSQENNTPMLALQTVFSTLGTAGVVPDKDCIVQTQRRNEVSPALAF